MLNPKLWRFLVPVLALAAATSGAGCGGGAPAVSNSRTEATVHGKVVVRGKPATRGRVVFNPANYLRKDVSARDVVVNPDGTYEITTLLGENAVSYEGPAVSGSRELEGISLTCDVKEGENEFDVIIPPQ